MRLLFASSGLGALAVVLATSAHAETVVSTATTAPLSTTTAGDIHVTTAGSIKPTSGAAITVNSNNTVKNEGTIGITGSNGAVGILANPGFSGDITNSGTITIDEDYTPTDTDKDGDLDGPFAQGNGRFAIHVLSGGTYTGNIVHSGTITLEGNQSAGIAVDSALTGSLSTTGKISVIGDDSVGIRAGAVSGNVTIGNGSTTTVLGKNSVGVLLGGDVGGSVVIQGTVVSSGYRSTSAPPDPSKLDADDLLQGGSAVVVSGNVAHGILLDAKPADLDPNEADEDHDGVPDAQETTANVTTYGSAPALAIGSATKDINIGAVTGSANGIVIKGSVGAAGVYNAVQATAVSIGGTGHEVQVAGGMTVNGNLGAMASGASATGIHVGAGASLPTISVGGSIIAQGGGTAASAADALLIEIGASVNSVTNKGSITATRAGDSGTAAAIVDKSGTLSLVENSGSIAVTNAASLGDLATAIDVRANMTGAIVRQLAGAQGSAAPAILGNILFGVGNDTLDVQAGSVSGKVDFGGGNDVLNLGGGAVFHGTLANSGGAAVSLGSGSVLDLKNNAAVNLASLTTAGGSSLGVTIAAAGHTLYNVAGAATFGTGTKILVTLDRVGTAAGSYTIIDAGSLVGGENLTSSVVTLPFLFNSELMTDAANGEVTLNIQRKDNGGLGLNRSEMAIVDAALEAADKDLPFSSVFLSVGDSATLKSTLQQMLPEHSGGVFETVTKGSRLAADILASPKSLSGLWFQQEAWGSSKGIGDTSSYKLDGWGANAGYDIALGAAGNVGVTAAYFFGRDSHFGDLISNHYEGGLYWRDSIGPFHAWARGTFGTINFDSKRNFSGSSQAGTVTRQSEGQWNGRVYSGSGGLSYEAHAGRLSIRPNASIEYYKLNEDGYTESGGGDGFDLTVGSRKSDEAAANAMLALGYDIDRADADSEGWFRVELEGGRRQILSGSIGDTVASFGTGTAFTLSADQRESGWRGGLRVLGGGSMLNFGAELNAEQQQGGVSIGGRVAVTIAM